MTLRSRWLLVLTAAAMAALACGQPAAVLPTPAEPSPLEPSSEAPGPTAAPAANVVAVMVVQERIELRALDGTLAGSWDAPGISWPRPDWVQAVGEKVYYLKGPEGMVSAVSATGRQDYSYTTMPGLSAFVVSPDERMMAWSTTTYAEGVVSQLWLASIDGSGERMLLQSDPNDDFSDWFALEPVAFGQDGRLVYAWQITGIGGYILFFGYSSLYSVDPPTGSLAPLVALLSDSTGPCWSAVRGDLGYAVGHCLSAAGDLAMRERNLSTGEDRAFPTFADQGQAGGAAYSPSGNRLAYAIARGDPDDEAGQILVRLTPDVDPVPIVSVDGGYFSRLYWLDEDRLLAAGLVDGVDRAYVVTLDGGLTPIAEGGLAGWMRLP